MNLYTFVITSPIGTVLDFGTYYRGDVAGGTAVDSPAWQEDNRFTLVKHDDDGSWGQEESFTIFPRQGTRTASGDAPALGGVK